VACEALKSVLLRKPVIGREILGVDARKPTFGARLRAAREARGLSQVAAAVGAGIDPSSLSRYENDKVMPGSEELKMLCIYLQTSADELLGLTRQAPMPELRNDAEWQAFLQRPVAQLAKDHGVLDAVHRAQLNTPGISVSDYEAIAWHMVRSAVEKTERT
jgi:transcriptional regulator with XRE-family HTH domain